MATALGQETLKLEHRPLTRDLPDEFDMYIEIISSSRKHSDGLPKANFEPQAPPFRQYLSHLPIVAVHYVVVIANKRTGEVWECKMTPVRTRTKKCLDINNGQFILESTLEPTDGITDISVRDWKGNDLPPFAAGIGFVLPADISMQYDVTLKLFSVNGLNKREVCSKFHKVTTFEERENHDLANLQEGKGLECIERPIPKTKPQGILATPLGTEIIKHFQNLIDNGEQERFLIDMEEVETFVQGAPKFQDLLVSILMEKSYFYQDERSVEASQKALKVARKYHSANENRFLCMAKGFEAVLSAKEGFFSNARQHIEEQNEISNEMAPGENKALVCYDWVQYFAEKAASLGELSEEEWEDAERYFDALIRYHNSDELMQVTGNHRLPMQGCIRRLSLYLKTSRRKPPQFDFEVSHTDLGKAEDLLIKIRRIYPNFLSTRQHVLLFMCETDLQIHRNEFGKALKPCFRGLQLARRLGKASLIKRMKERLRMLLATEETSEEELAFRFRFELADDVQNFRLDSDGQTQTQIGHLLESLLVIEDDI